jgi:hypothetical protein
VSRVWLVTLPALVVATVADLLVGAEPPGFTPVFAFAGCVLIIVASKWLGRYLLQRGEEYYEVDSDA